MKKLEIRQNSSSILYTNKKRQALSPPRIDIRQDEQTILASVTVESWRRGAMLHLGDPDCTDKDDWISVRTEDWKASKYKFVFAGRSFVWTRTHNKELGATKIGGRDFKLVEEGNEQVLMVCRHNYAVLKKGVFATIDYYVDVGPDVELLALAAILGIEELTARGPRLQIMADDLAVNGI